MNEFDVQEGFSFNQVLGYGSKYDGETIEYDLCCDCFDVLIEESKISPIVHTLPEYRNDA